MLGTWATRVFTYGIATFLGFCLCVIIYPQEVRDVSLKAQIRVSTANNLGPQAGQQCKIYVLDISNHYGLDDCSAGLDDEIISKTGTIWRADDVRWLKDVNRAPHWTSQHAGPYWLKKALESDQYSKYVTDSMDQADAVFVYDYCFAMRFLSRLHSQQHPALANDAERDMKTAYKELAKLPRFQRHEGHDFAFFYSHPLTFKPVEEQHCISMSKSLKLVVEAGQVNVCPWDEAKANRLIVPYSSPEFVDDGEQYPHRDSLMFFLGACHETANLGKSMRFSLGSLEAAFNATTKFNATVSCVQRMPHSQLRHKMRSSIFCLLPPGDTSSSRRLTDIVLAGCIPVFIGRPWHSMPLADFIDYKCRNWWILVVAKTLEVLPASFWASSVADTVYWVPDANITDAVIHINTVKDIAPTLQELSSQVIDAKLKAVAAAKSRFLYRSSAAKSLQGPTVIDAIVDAMCLRAEVRQKERRPFFFRTPHLITLGRGMLMTSIAKVTESLAICCTWRRTRRSIAICNIVNAKWTSRNNIMHM